MARYVIENPSKPDQVDVWWDQPQFVKDEHGKNTTVIKTDGEGRQIYRRCVCRSIDKALADSLNKKFNSTSQMLQEFDSLKVVVQDRHTSVQDTINSFRQSLENEANVRANNDATLQANIDATNNALNTFKNDYKVNVGVGLKTSDAEYAGSVLGRVSKLEDKLSTDSKGTFATKKYVIEKINSIYADALTAIDVANSAKTAAENANASVEAFNSRIEALEDNASEIEQLKARCAALEKFISRITNQSVTFDDETYDVVILAPEEPEE